MTVWERWIRWRNARLSDPRFQRWAARFPLTRGIARRQAAGLFDTVAGFVYAQVLAACVELDLFEAIGTGTIDARALAALADVPIASATTLLKAAAALDLCEQVSPGRYALGSRGAAILGNPGIAAMVTHHALLYADLADPVALLRERRGSLAGFWHYAEGADAEAVTRYSDLMAKSQAMVAEQVLDAYDFSRHRRLLDVGGGEGAFLGAVAARHPTLERALFDLPAVADRAQARLGERVSVTAGNFLTDELPMGADVISLVRILHDHDDDHAIALLRAIRKALAPGGRLVIAEPMAGTPGARAMGDAYFGLYLLAMGSGRPRTAGELSGMAVEAGFAGCREVATAIPMITRVLIAQA